MSETKPASLSGLTPAEAQEIHKYFMQGFLGFVGASFIAHILVAVLWRWPWFPSEDGTYGSLLEGAKHAAVQISQVLA